MRRLKLFVAAAMLATSPMIAAHAADKPAKVSVTYVSSPFNVPSIIMRKKGFLDDAFGALGVKTENPEITSGGAQIQALAAGAIDIASVLGGTSAILGRANGIDLKVIAAYSRSPKAFFVMTGANGPGSIEALKGKSVAGPKGTTLNQLLAAALASKGMKLTDVEYLNMELPAARAALLAGKVDAATLAGANALQVEAAGGRILASGEGLIAPISVIAVRGAFLREQPALVAAYLAAHRKALDFMRDNPEEALKIAAEDQKISIDDARKQLPWYDFTLAMTDRDIENLAGDQRFMVEAGMLQKTIDIRADLIDPLAFKP
ncbi:NrtA/SsuA/CpmA family ABC transporter substrate-binding protein [Bosea sp. 685]|uniref:ABC transporter substrate-binding protein n=1 Tax=Bosea sp. 685 TaxID=3080057 RepID=UPI002892EDE2|nr:NrtA/SsuA/CpmA family ABC transporter substrate-binding protein [Bosea sp. 685]WNJ92579.1 NrtA/SsuA/CpmA family ABC transporter substrate-binding protein [Bosea sp. 685]